MKNLTLLILLVLPFALLAQGVFTNHTHTALQQVIGDYPNHFRNIKGEIVNEDPQSINYESKVQIPGASTAMITKYSSAPDKEIYSWKCIMAESEDFNAIATKYKELYNQIRNSIVKVEGEKPFILNGLYEVPTEDKRFVSSVFSLLPSIGNLGKLKVELVLEYYVTEWKISLIVYDQQEEEMFAMEEDEND
jgi:hypothetical protein